MPNDLLNKLTRPRARVVVNAPVESVFDYLADFAHNANWCDIENYALVRVEQTSTGGVGLGSTFRMQVRQTVTTGGAKSEFDRDYEVEITEFVRNERLTFRSYRPFTFEMEPGPAGTRLWLRQNWAETRKPEARRRRGRGALEEYEAAIANVPADQGRDDTLLWLLAFPAWPIIWIHNWLVSSRILFRVKEAVERKMERAEYLKELDDIAEQRRRRGG